jgi:hypothetical protein
MLIPLGILAGSGAVPESSYLLMQLTSSPFLGAYDWNGGFGTRRLLDSDLISYNEQRSVSWSKTGAYVTSASSQYGFSPVRRPIAITWNNPGFGTRYFSTAENDPRDTGFSDQENYFVATFNNSPWIGAWPFSGSGFGTRLSNPSTSLGEFGNGIHFNPAGDYVAVATVSSPRVHAYAFSAGWGSKVSNPATIITSEASGIRFNNDGSRLLVSSRSSPFIHVYAFSGGFGTKYSNPASLPTHEPDNIPPTWSFDGSQVAIPNSNTRAFAVYPWNGTSFGTRYTNPADVPTDYGQLGFSKSGKVFASPSGNNIFAWDFVAGTGFGTKYANPATAPGSDVRAVQFSPQ